MWRRQFRRLIGFPRERAGGWGEGWRRVVGWSQDWKAGGRGEGGGNEKGVRRFTFLASSYAQPENDKGGSVRVGYFVDTGCRIIRHLCKSVVERGADNKLFLFRTNTVVIFPNNFM